MRNGLNDDSVRDVDLSPQPSDASHKAKNRRYDEIYRQNIDSGQSVREI